MFRGTITGERCSLGNIPCFAPVELYPDTLRGAYNRLHPLSYPYYPPLLTEVTALDSFLLGEMNDCSRSACRKGSLSLVSRRPRFPWSYRATAATAARSFIWALLMTQALLLRTNIETNLATATAVSLIPWIGDILL